MTHKYKEKKKFYHSLLERCECQACGLKEPCCLQFHHLFSYKDSNVARLALRYSPIRVLAEIAITACLCANCHCKLHYGKLKDTILKRVDISLFEDLVRDYYTK